MQYTQDADFVNLMVDSIRLKTEVNTEHTLLRTIQFRETFSTFSCKPCRWFCRGSYAYCEYDAVVSRVAWTRCICKFCIDISVRGYAELRSNCSYHYRPICSIITSVAVCRSQLTSAICTAVLYLLCLLALLSFRTCQYNMAIKWH